ncbi:MAG: SCO family protein, partial [Solirubrobacterales bacterium]|nr:SCO family protein [Solirubrobacterales bacterium]
MPARVRLALLTAASLVLLGALGFVVLYDGGDDAGGQGFQGALAPDVPVRDFTLADQDGRRVRLADLQGRPVVLTFLYTTCQDTCPTTAQQVRIAMDEVGRDVPFLAVSVDPGNDTPVRARRFLTRQHLNGRLRFLLGTRAQLQPIWKAYGIRPQGDGFEHTAHVLLLA